MLQANKQMQKPKYQTFADQGRGQHSSSSSSRFLNPFPFSIHPHVLSLCNIHLRFSSSKKVFLFVRETLTQQCRNDLSHIHQLLIRRWENVSTGLVRDRATAFYLHQVLAHCKTMWIRDNHKFAFQNLAVGIFKPSILLTYEIIPQSTSHVQVEKVLAFLPPPPLEGELCAPYSRKNAPLQTLHTANDPAY